MASQDLDIERPGTRRSRRRAVVSIAVTAAAGLLAVGCGSSSSGGSGGSGASSASSGGASPASGALGPAIGSAGSGPVFTTVGPNGEKPTPASAVTVTPAEVTALQNGHYTAAMVWHEAATFTSAVTAGAQAEFKRLGIKVVSVTQANFDAATQTNQLQTVEAQHPSAILSLPVNPTTEASAYKAVQKMGSKLVIMSNVPAGLTWPADYAGMVTDDLAQMGKEGAVLLGTAMHGQGDVGFIYYNADYYVTNERDASFRSWLHKLYPGIHIVDQEPMADQSNAQTVATAMLTRYPNIQGVYAPWAQTPAEGVIAALRSLGRTNVKLVTDDLDPSIDANLMTGQFLSGIVADQPYLVGKTQADIAALAILGKKTPAFTDVTALPVTKSNLISAWQTTLNQPAPANVKNAH
jgi:ribose transport system substrate-binding protein